MLCRGSIIYLFGCSRVRMFKKRRRTFLEVPIMRPKYLGSTVYIGVPPNFWKLPCIPEWCKGGEEIQVGWQATFSEL